MRFLRILLAAASLGALTLPTGPAGAAAPPACDGANGAPDRIVTGSFGAEHRGAYVLVPFEVPANSTSVRVKLCYDQLDLPDLTLPPPAPVQAGLRHTLDLGIYDASTDGFWDANEFRGWGGSSRLNVLITPEESTTVGFDPGPVPAGMWAAEIGVAAVAETGDLDGRVAWRLEIFTGSKPADADTPWTPAAYDETPANPNPGWYKGDMHVHAEHSNPKDATMGAAFGYAFKARESGGAGLDFITLSDYVTDRHWDEIGRLQSSWPDKLVIRSAEVITYRGHINNHASHTWVDYRTGPIYELQDDHLIVRRSASPPSNIFDAVHTANGWTQVNHPTIFPSKVPPFALQCRGCSWEYSDAETQWSKVDAFEITTGPAGYTDPKGNEPGPNPFTPLAIEWWDRLRRDGNDITGVGASDSHKASAESLTSSPIGEATTVVYAPELSEAGIRQGVLAGHAYVKFFSSDGPDLRFDAAPPTGPSVMMGDALHADAGLFTASVLNIPPVDQTSPLDQARVPRVLLVVHNGVPIHAVPVATADFTFKFPTAVPGDYRLQLMRGTAIEAVSNPITLCPVLVPQISPDARCSE
jgi:hypothetical protein